jgi:hypothetical protein
MLPQTVANCYSEEGATQSLLIDFFITSDFQGAADLVDGRRVRALHLPARATAVVWDYPVQTDWLRSIDQWHTYFQDNKLTLQTH